MKVVINKCFGGFGLSTEALKRAIADDISGITRMTENDYTGGRGRGIGSETFKDAGDGYEVGWIEDVLYKDGMVYTHNDHEESARTCPKLVKLVEDMGDAANGRHARLAIIEIPDGVDWEIDEYDGNETIREVSRSWG